VTGVTPSTAGFELVADAGTITLARAASSQRHRRPVQRCLVAGFNPAVDGGHAGHRRGEACGRRHLAGGETPRVAEVDSRAARQRLGRESGDGVGDVIHVDVTAGGEHAKRRRGMTAVALTSPAAASRAVPTPASRGSSSVMVSPQIETLAPAAAFCVAAMPLPPPRAVKAPVAMSVIAPPRC